MVMRDMDIATIVGLGLIGSILLVVVRVQRPEMAVQLSIAIGAIIFLSLVGKLIEVVQLLMDLALRSSVNRTYLTVLLKVIGVAYITEFGAQICKDAGENSVASKIEFAGKVMIMVMALPILLAILEMVMRLLP
jgi:stage III sporulation protein AD